MGFHKYHTWGIPTWMVYFMEIPAISGWFLGVPPWLRKPPTSTKFRWTNSEGLATDVSYSSWAGMESWGNMKQPEAALIPSEGKYTLRHFTTFDCTNALMLENWSEGINWSPPRWAIYRGLIWRYGSISGWWWLEHETYVSICWDILGIVIPIDLYFSDG